MLGQFFKPHWKHQSARVRLKAVDLFDLTQAEDRDNLILMAKGDCDTSVRCAAIGRLSDLSLLLQFYRQDSDPDIRTAAGQRCLALLSGTGADAPCLENRLRAIRLLDDTSLLYGLLVSGMHPACLEAALEKIDDPQRLFHYAIHGADSLLREKAASRIKQPDWLRQLLREGRDKKVLQYARDQLRQLQAIEHDHHQQQQHITEVLLLLEQHAKRTLDNLYAPRLEHLREQWRSSSDHASSLDRERAQALFAEANQRHLHWQETLIREQHQQEAEAVRRQTLAAIQDLYTNLTDEQWQAGLDTLETTFQHLDKDWQKSLELAPASADEDSAHAHLTKRWQKLMEQAAVLLGLNETCQYPISSEIQKEVTAALSAWPDGVNLPPFGHELKKHGLLSDLPKESSKNQRPHHGNLVHQLRQALNQRNLKKANRIWQRLMHALEKHPDPISEKQSQSLKSQLDELRDWHAFAADPKKETLCERMEALATSPLSHPEEQANAIQVLHDQWHELMSSDQAADQMLWERFKEASDIAYAPCREHFRELDAKRSGNLEQRRNICQQLQTLLEGQDWEQAQGAALWEIRCQAPKDWQAASPVRYTDAREVNQRFHQLLKNFDKQLQTLSDRHRPQLEQLLKELEALATATHPDTSAQLVKSLQKRWREVGWVHPHHYRKLERQKRQHCDAIYGRREAAQRQQKEEQRQLTLSLQHELETLKVLLDAPSPDLKQLDAAMSQIRDQPEPANANPLLQQKQALLKRASSTQQQIRRAQYWRTWQERINQSPNRNDDSPALRQFCVAMEVSSGCDSPEFAHQERLAWQVENLAQAMKSSRQPPPDTCRKLLDEHQQLLTDGLDQESRVRLLKVVEHLQQA
jgi:hypothetical protein